MKRIYSTILIIVCGIFAALPVQAEIPVEIPLCFFGFCSGDEEVHISYAQMLTADGPGSSTVEPVDPNQVKVELDGCTLSVHENAEGSVEIMISNDDLHKTLLYTRFDDLLTVQLTDTATYSIIIRLEDMPLAYGRFRYPAFLNKKVMRNGQLYIRQGNSFYALPGTKVE